MFDMIKKIWQVGTVTEKQPFKKSADNYKGRIKLSAVAGTNWAECAAVCPTGALQTTEQQVTLFEGGCIFCGRCAERCRTKGIVQTNDCYTAVFAKEAMYQRIDLKEGKADE